MLKIFKKRHNQTISSTSSPIIMKQLISQEERKTIMFTSPLIKLSETELRDLCRHNFDSFEQWSRRLIDEKFKENYGENYYDIETSLGQPLIKTSIKKQIDGRMRENPSRFPRNVDAIVMEDIIYFFCRDDLYQKMFKSIFESFFSGIVEIRSVLERLVLIRNKLSHGNAISIHEAEQCICYSNDFIERFKHYYQLSGREREYNVPVFTRIKDSLGNDFIREHMEWYPWEFKMFGYSAPKIQLRSFDVYKIWVEVDGSYSSDSYKVSWDFKCGNSKLAGDGNEITIHLNDSMVSYIPEIHFKLKTNNSWHRRAMCDSDDDITINLDRVLPSVKDM